MRYIHIEGISENKRYPDYENAFGSLIELIYQGRKQRGSVEERLRLSYQTPSPLLAKERGRKWVRLATTR